MSSLFNSEAFEQIPGQLSIEQVKDYNVRCSIGKCRYVVSYHDGIKTHADGSQFYDCAIFGNKRDLARFLKGLEAQGYVQR